MYFICHITVPPQIMMYGPATAILGTIISINCTVIQGQPGIHIVTPSGYTVDSTEITFNATLDDMGNYTCVATTSGTTVTKFHTLIVHGMYDADHRYSHSLTYCTVFLLFFFIL